jgi:hypothetical protein
MTSLLHNRPRVEAPSSIRVVRDPVIPPTRPIEERDQADYWVPTECPDPRAALPITDWFTGQVAWHRHLGESSPPNAPLHELVATALQDLALSFSQVRAASVSDFLRRAPAPFRGLQLDRVAIPATRSMGLADSMDEQAAYYLGFYSDLGRLVAWSILQHSEGLERHAATTVQQYLDAEDADADAAAFNAYDDLFAAGELPLW